MRWKWPPYVIFIGDRIIKEMPGSVASGTPCITMHGEKKNIKSY